MDVMTFDIFFHFRNFAELARRGYYNGTKFHRIIADFMIQGEYIVDVNLTSGILYC